MSGTPRLTLELSEEEARWLATAVTVLRRVLQGVPSRNPDLSDYSLEGLAALHRVAERLPPGLYP